MDAEHIADLKERFGISPLIDADIDVGQFGLVSLSPNVDHDLRLSVTAAVIARVMGYKSIDRVRKKISASASIHQPRDIEIRDMCDRHLGLYDAFYRAFVPRSGERIGIFAFDLAMIRSRGSIELMLSVSRQGFLIEPCLIARSIIEQYAYAWKVWSTDEDRVIFETKPQSVITGLKTISPLVGQAYGLLSELSHYDPRMHISFIHDVDLNDPEDNAMVTQRSWLFKMTAIAWVFFILDLKFRIFKQCYGEYANFNILESIEDEIIEIYDTVFRNVDFKSIQKIRDIIAAK